MKYHLFVVSVWYNWEINKNDEGAKICETLKLLIGTWVTMPTVKNIYRTSPTEQNKSNHVTHYGRNGIKIKKRQPHIFTVYLITKDKKLIQPKHTTKDEQMKKIYVLE